MAALSSLNFQTDRLTGDRWRHRLAMALASLLALLAAFWWWAAPEGVAAHANLASANPEPNSELDTAPDRVIIWFTEPIEPALSKIGVLDTTGKRVDEGNTALSTTSTRW